MTRSAVIHALTRRHGGVYLPCRGMPAYAFFPRLKNQITRLSLSARTARRLSASENSCEFFVIAFQEITYNYSTGDIDVSRDFCKFCLVMLQKISHIMDKCFGQIYNCTAKSSWDPWTFLKKVARNFQKLSQEGARFALDLPRDFCYNETEYN